MALALAASVTVDPNTDVIVEPSNDVPTTKVAGAGAFNVTELEVVLLPVTVTVARTPAVAE